MEGLGGQIMCSSSRECISYQSSHFHRSTPLAVSLIADTVLNPSFLPNAISAQKDAARYEIREISAKPEMILPEVLHLVAYGGKTLGNPLLCPEDRIDLIDEHLLRSCIREWFTPDRIVIAGAGVQHEELVELVDKYFSSLKSPATTSPSLSPRATASLQPIPPHTLPSPNPSITKQLVRTASSYLFPSVTSYQADHASSLITSEQRPTATYTGGHHFVFDPLSEFNHVYVAFEGAGIHDDDVYTLATMQVLLGGGGSFSAGGPGKGMYSRLYTQILNHYPQIDHCASFHHIYTDSSLFGLFASVHPLEGSSPAQVLPHLLNQLSLLVYSPVKRQELLRAQSQLKSSLTMALESRAVEVEDLGRQVSFFQTFNV
jgi:mitochondrial-processing peptidase subunit alpha